MPTGRNADHRKWQCVAGMPTRVRDVRIWDQTLTTVRSSGEDHDWELGVEAEMR